VKGLSPLSKLSWGRAEGSKLDEGEILGFLRSEFSTIFGIQDFYIRDCFVWEKFAAPKKWIQIFYLVQQNCNRPNLLKMY
jgi:hypothetical protein